MLHASIFKKAKAKAPDEVLSSAVTSNWLFFLWPGKHLVLLSLVVCNSFVVSPLQDWAPWFSGRFVVWGQWRLGQPFVAVSLLEEAHYHLWGVDKWIILETWKMKFCQYFASARWKQGEERTCFRCKRRFYTSRSVGVALSLASMFYSTGCRVGRTLVE